MSSPYGELIDSLPMDKETVHSDQQIQLANMLFKENEGTLNVLARELKDGIIIAFLFVLFESQQVTDLIKRFFPSSNASYLFLVGIKSTLVVLLFYLIKNFALAKRT